MPTPVETAETYIKVAEANYSGRAGVTDNPAEYAAAMTDLMMAKTLHNVALAIGVNTALLNEIKGMLQRMGTSGPSTWPTR